MKRKDVEKHLRAHGCAFHHHGAKHDQWVNPANGQKAAVPRHNTIPPGTVRAICRQLGISFPGSA